jgi:hypothetical protein
MATSPNYAWAEPDNSSLVKNGAQDIRALGDAIDTSVWNIGFGQAGKNKIINGDFYINQRAFTSTTTTGTYGFDRFRMLASGGTTTYSAQTFTTGTAPVAGYEGKNFARIATTGQTGTNPYSIINQNIEDVRTLAGQTMTLSFWAKAASGTPKVALDIVQQFGSGGSADVYTSGSFVTLSTSWARYSFTVAIPSVSGKTIGDSSLLGIWLWVSAGTDFNSRAASIGIQTNTFDFWGVQAEYGSKATPFQTATGTFQGELAACQRYYYSTATGSDNYSYFGIGQAISSSAAKFAVPFPVRMRISPTSVVPTGNIGCLNSGNTAINNGTVTVEWSSNNQASLNITSTSGLTAGNATVVLGNNSATASLAFSAEL